MQNKDSRQFNILRIRYLLRPTPGVSETVTLAATTLAVTFLASEVDTSYGVIATPNWSTTCYITAKAVTGFTINFGTGAPANATVDYIVFRKET